MSAKVVLLGNDAPMMQRRVPVIDENGEVQIEQRSMLAEHLNQTVTRVELWDGVDDPEFVDHTLSTENDRMLSMIARNLGKDHRKAAVAAHEIEQLWGVHSGQSPAWVACEDADLQAALAKHFGCPEGEPTNLLTNLGRDDLHAQHLGTSAQPAAYNFMGLTANATAASASNTSLTAEITTAGGGLIRKQATYAHTGGTNTSTLTATFTANGTDSLPVTIAKIGIFKHITTAATMGYESLMNATSTITISGDNVTVTDTVTAG